MGGLPAVLAASVHALGVVHGYPPLGLVHHDDADHDQDGEHTDDEQSERGRAPGLAEYRLPNGGGQPRDDSGKDDERNALADAVFRDEFTEPNQEHCARGHADDECETAEKCRAIEEIEAPNDAHLL